MADLKLESFTNEFGQVINPGDEVIYAGTSYKSTRILPGKFGGVLYDNVTKSVRRLNENGEQVKNERGYALWDTVVSYEPVAIKIVDVIDDVYDREQKKYVKGIRPRPAILHYKRVYKIDTPLKSFTGKSF